MFFTPFTQTQQIFSAWSELASQNLARLEALDKQLQEIEDQNAARAHEAVDEAAKLMKASLTYWQDMGKAWRKHTVETTKQAASMVVPGA